MDALDRGYVVELQDIAASSSHIKEMQVVVEFASAQSFIYSFVR